MQIREDKLEGPGAAGRPGVLRERGTGTKKLEEHWFRSPDPESGGRLSPGLPPPSCGSGSPACSLCASVSSHVR